MLECGEEVEKDTDTAIELYRRAASQGERGALSNWIDAVVSYCDAAAQFKAAEIFECGVGVVVGVERDLATACRLYRRASSQGHELAQSKASEIATELAEIVALGSYLERHAKAEVLIVDLDYESVLGNSDPGILFEDSWDIIGISCYSSFDFQRSMSLAREIRSALSDVCLVVGGYHPSACPEDFCGDDSPFNYIVIGEGEIPMMRIVGEVKDVQLPHAIVLPAMPLPSMDEMPYLNWELLDR